MGLEYIVNDEIFGVIADLLIMFANVLPLRRFLPSARVFPQDTYN